MTVDKVLMKHAVRCNLGENPWPTPNIYTFVNVLLK
jgi:hypothetical protein